LEISFLVCLSNSIFTGWVTFSYQLKHAYQGTNERKNEKKTERCFNR